MDAPSSALNTNGGGVPPLIRVLLSDSACYDHPVEKIKLVETHISWVLLTGDYAYKIKKPVNLGFLDFSTLALREQDCVDELRLNRRLAADIYLEVVAITGTPEAPRINGSGDIFEYAVKMRQFPPNATMDHLAERDELGNVQIDALAVRLAHFHLYECDHAQANSLWGEPDVIARPVEENFKILVTRLDDPADRRCLEILRSWCETEHSRLAPLMRERKKNGRVRECHGDLHLANLAWVDGRLVIFDCLEFNSALRWIDVISEVAFCYMDLLHRKYAGLAARFLNVWLEASGDYQGVALLRYYAVYRALVRAKVAALRADQGCSASRAELVSCLQLAEQLSQPPPCQPAPPDESSRGQGQTNRCANFMLTITHGLSGSGKTTLTQTLLEKYGMIRLRSDVERKRLAGLAAQAKSRSEDGLYTQQFSRRTYEHLVKLAEGLLAAGWQVVVDAAFLEREQRDLFRDLAQRLGMNFQILHIQADPAVLLERVRLRQTAGTDASEADLRVLEHQLKTALPLGDDELSATVNPFQAGLTS
ncbi:MAG: AAA family ATPase [Gallionella sp.]|jgi:hypothetical protein